MEAGLWRPDTLHVEKPVTGADTLHVEKPVMPVALCAVDHAKHDALTAGVERMHAKKPAKGADALPAEKPVMLVALRAADPITPDALPAAAAKPVKPVMPVALPDVLPVAVEKPVTPVALHVAAPGSCQQTSERRLASPTCKFLQRIRRWLWP